jgi:hypothetical protein
VRFGIIKPKKECKKKIRTLAELGPIKDPLRERAKRERTWSVYDKEKTDTENEKEKIV